MRKIVLILIALSIQLTTLSCDSKAPIDDLDRREEVPVEDTFEPIPTEIP